MKLVERHIIKQGHEFHAECDRVCFASKNLYNQALYRVRQHFFDTGKYLSYYELQKQLQNEKQVDYKNLPANIVCKESYTSKCSFFDNEPIQQQEKYVGKRIKRSWFRTACGSLVHADINAAYNMGEKQFPKAFVPKEIEGVVVHPTRLTPCK